MVGSFLERGAAAATWVGAVVVAVVLLALMVTVAFPARDAPPLPAMAPSLSPVGGSGLVGATGVWQDACSPGGAARLADPPEPAEDQTYRDPHALSQEEAAELDRQLRQAAPERIPEQHGARTIPVVLHVVADTDGTGELSRDTVQEQVTVLNDAFSGAYGGFDTGFRFSLREVTRTTDDAWFHRFAANEREVKRELRVGGPEVLNIYSTRLGAGVLGRSTFPQDYAERPYNDGVVIDHRSVPGGAHTNFDLGHTATHEVGHWLGLFHTFQNGCAYPGDYVADTPYERIQATGCPEGRNTCPHRWGTDPVHNFMNYSDDACMSEFTAGQAHRMAMAWYAFRDPVG
ncbi:zinc metalloprotease [Lipingzhangella sp. LS1_29]|uniref:Zinc metalloprotease n=1 Tax=Lipingzhangella rawalii TaxID=2055835 RepID=A0ABU2H5D1_9ACTN|nr:zinc metalloprotease [Lipingzhangella rawalii]MDS1270503.1 zinc metalloprotease [Lipingzhangella rawalii]